MLNYSYSGIKSGAWNCSTDYWLWITTHRKTNKHKTNDNDKKDNRQYPSHGVSNDTQVPEYLLIFLKANLFCVVLIFNKSDSAGYVTFCQYTM